MAEYRKGSHTVYNIEYHMVWVTKYRYQVLRGEVALRTRELIRQSCLSRGIIIIRGSVSKDHVHLLVSCPPSLAPAKILQYLKGRSSRLLQQEFEHLRKKYWGQQPMGEGIFLCNCRRNYRGYGKRAVSPEWAENLWVIAGFALAGTMFIIPTAAEIPIIQSMMSFGLGVGPAAALLVTLPAVSLPSLYIVRNAFPARVLVMATFAVALLGVLSGVLAALVY